MWIGHYIAGMLFYLGVSIAIWIEAAREFVPVLLLVTDIRSRTNNSIS